MNLLFNLFILAFLGNYVVSQDSATFPTTKPKPKSCITSSETSGVCRRRLRRCPGDLSSVKPTYCKSGTKRKICCPILEQIKLVSAPVTNFECGKKGLIPIIFGFSSLVRRRRSSLNRPSLELEKSQNRPSVVGGIESFKNSWPWMVLVRNQNNKLFCGGAVINQEYVLTAAHCVLNLDPYIVQFGVHNQNPLSTAVQPESIEVVDVIFHPKYSIPTAYNDIALLKLSRSVQFRREVGPVCLPWETLVNDDLVNNLVTVTGWGSEQFGARESPVLREVNLVVFDSSVCHTSYSTLPDFKTTYPDGLNKFNILCAGDSAGGKDACRGDSGGPMVHEEADGSYTLAGIVSKGYGCGLKEFPGLYTPLRNYETLLWIKNTAF